MQGMDEYNRQGRTAELQSTRRKFSSSNNEPKPVTSSSKDEPTRKDFLGSILQRKAENLKAYNARYAPTWRKESLLDQLNRSLSVKQQQQQQLEEIPKHLMVLDENEDYQLEKNYFFTLIRRLPTDRLNRTEQNMGEFVKELPKLNFFFKGHSFMYICSLFKVGKIRFFQEGDVIYEKKNESNEFSLILWGKVKLSDRKDFFKKVSRRGETLGEEILFTKIRSRQEKATALEQCYLLEMDLRTYQIFYQTMIGNKLKAEVLMMQKNIKRNFLAKNSLRGTRLQ